jgi:hypothetical protein
MELYMYAAVEATLSRIIARNPSTGSEKLVKAIISDEFVSKLANLYEYAW